MIGSDNAFVTIRRLVRPVGEDAQERWERTNGIKYEDLGVYIEQIDPEVAVAFGNETAFRMFKMFTDEVLDIKESDRVTDHEGTEYTVQGLLTFKNNTDTGNHQEITMVAKYE